MTEKYRGILPPNSIWYKLDTKKASLILINSEISGEIEPDFKNKYVFGHELDAYTEIQVPEGQIEKFEQILLKYQENITTLH